MAVQPAGGPEEFAIPDALPVLPLRDAVVFPLTAVPLAVAEPRSVRLVDDVMRGNRLLALATRRSVAPVPPTPDDLHRVGTLAVINQFLLQQVERRQETVLIIDEAQDLTDDLLEQVRLLSNLETDNRKLLQIVLMGQPELRDRLNNPRLRQLRQRITVRYHLQPLSRYEVSQYIQHRLEVSGAKGAPYFTQPALWRVYSYSKGIPRLVNAVCDKALLAGFVQQQEKIGFGVVGRAVRELEGQIEA